MNIECKKLREDILNEHSLITCTEQENGVQRSRRESDEGNRLCHQAATNVLQAFISLCNFVTDGWISLCKKFCELNSVIVRNFCDPTPQQWQTHCRKKQRCTYTDNTVLQMRNRLLYGAISECAQRRWGTASQPSSYDTLYRNVSAGIVD